MRQRLRGEGEVQSPALGVVDEVLENRLEIASLARADRDVSTGRQFFEAPIKRRSRLWQESHIKLAAPGRDVRDWR